MNYLRWWLIELGAHILVNRVIDERAREDARGPAEEVEWGNELFTVVVD